MRSACCTSVAVAGHGLRQEGLLHLRFQQPGDLAGGVAAHRGGAFHQQPGRCCTSRALACNRSHVIRPLITKAHRHRTDEDQVELDEQFHRFRDSGPAVRRTASAFSRKPGLPAGPGHAACGQGAATPHAGKRRPCDAGTRARSVQDNPRRQRWTMWSQAGRELDVVVVGAGFAGLYLLHSWPGLQRAGAGSRG